MSQSLTVYKSIMELTVEWVTHPGNPEVPPYVIKKLF